MAELTKNDLIIILEVCLLNFEGKDLHEMLEYKFNYNHLKMGKDTLDFIKTKW